MYMYQKYDFLKMKTFIPTRNKYMYKKPFSSLKV